MAKKDEDKQFLDNLGFNSINLDKIMENHRFPTLNTTAIDAISKAISLSVDPKIISNLGTSIKLFQNSLPNMTFGMPNIPNTSEYIFPIKKGMFERDNAVKKDVNDYKVIDNTQQIPNEIIQHKLLKDFLEKNNFRFVIGTKRISKKIKSDIEQILVLAEKSYISGAFQGALYYISLAFETIVKNKLQLTKFRNKLLAHKLYRKDLDEMTLGQLLGIDEDINEILFSNYNRSTKDCVKIVRNINAHKFNPKAGPDITSKMTDIIELSKKIR